MRTMANQRSCLFWPVESESPALEAGRLLRIHANPVNTSATAYNPIS
jgi:hypothetical protein